MFAIKWIFTDHGRRLCEQDLWKQSEQLDLESTRPCVAEEFLPKQAHNNSRKTVNNNIMRNNSNNK